jgi:glycerate 2-kinase
MKFFVVAVTTLIVSTPPVLPRSAAVAWIGRRFSCRRYCYHYRWYHNRQLIRRAHLGAPPTIWEYGGSSHKRKLQRAASTNVVSDADSPSHVLNTPDTTNDFSLKRTPEELQMTNDVISVVQAAIDAVDPAVAIRQCLTVEMKSSSKPKICVTDRRFKKQILSNDASTTVTRSYMLDQYGTIVVVGIGKAAAAMVVAVLDPIVQAIAATRVTNHEERSMPPLQNIVVPNIKGMVLTKHGHVSHQQRTFLESNNIIVREASHPIPCEAGVLASHELLELVSDSHDSKNSTSKAKLVIVCVSGGGSALFCTPQPPLTLDDLKATNAALMQTGWPISSVNIVRKALELGKGGGLARAALQPTSDRLTTTDVVSLILSDVMGDPLDIIASGPTVLQRTASIHANIQEALTLVKHRVPPNIQFPKAVLDLLMKESETTTSDKIDISYEEMDRHCFNCLVGNNAVAVEAAATKAIDLGYHPVILGTQIQGEASTVAQVLVGLAQHLQQQPSLHNMNHGGKFPVALIAGGETTVTLPAEDDTTCHGRLGGRNQELALAAALALHDYQLRQIVVASVGTDGNDGPTDAAGAVVDGGTAHRLDAMAATIESDSIGLNLTAKVALQCHNAYPYLNQADITGHSPLLKVCT